MPRLTRRRTLSANLLMPLPQPRRSSLLVSLLKLAAYTAILLTLSSALLARYKIEQTSMEPNFHPGQRVIVSQVNRMIGNWLHGSAYAAHPGAAATWLSRGQIVIFYESDDHSRPPLIKRLIGLPGDYVTIRDGVVFINDARLPEPYLAGPTSCDTYCQVRLGADEYYFLGDNRAVSRDSRHFGPAHGAQIVGRVIVRIWPLDEITLFL